MLRELGVFERALLISDRHAPFNVVSVLQLEHAPAPDIMQRAMRFVQEHHPLLGARIVELDRHFYFETIPNLPTPVAILQRTDAEQWQSIVESEMERRIDIHAGPLFRCIYLHGNGQAEIILTVHHSIMDAASGLNLLDELLQNCAALQTGFLPDATPLALIPAVEFNFPPAFRGLRRIPATLKYVFQQAADEFIYQWRVRGKRVPRVHAGGQGKMLSLQLSETLLDTLTKKSRAEKVTLNSLLNSALLLAVNKMLYAGKATPMRTFTFADLRSYTVPPTRVEDLANYISMLRYTVDVSAEKNIWDLTKDLHAKIYLSFKQGDKFVASLMSEPLMKMFTMLKSLRMGATGLSYSGAVDFKPEYNKIRASGLHAFISAYQLGPELTSQARIFNNQLWWDFAYLDTDMDRATAEKIIDEIRLILEAAVSDPVRGKKL